MLHSAPTWLLLLLLAVPLFSESCSSPDSAALPVSPSGGPCLGGSVWVPWVQDVLRRCIAHHGVRMASGFSCSKGREFFPLCAFISFLLNSWVLFMYLVFVCWFDHRSTLKLLSIVTFQCCCMHRLSMWPIFPPSVSSLMEQLVVIRQLCETISLIRLDFAHVFLPFEVCDQEFICTRQLS